MTPPPDPRTVYAWLVILSGAFLLGSFAVVSRIYRQIQARDQSGAASHLNTNACAWNLRDLGRIILWLFFGYSILTYLGMVLSRLNFLKTENHAAIFLIVSSALLYTQFFALTARLFKSGKTSAKEAFGLQTGSLHDILRAAGVGLAGIFPPMALVAGLTRLVYEYFHWPFQPQPLVQMLMKLNDPWILEGMFLVALVGAPIFEETFFRGMLYPCLKKKLGFIHALWINSALFAASHFHLPSFLPLFLLALMFTLLYEWKNNLIVCILCHSAFNALALCFLFFQGKG